MSVYYRIFLIHMERVLNFRSRMFVWFISGFLNPLLLLIFWVAVLKENGNALSSWSIPTITSYYLLLVIAGSLLVSHAEEDVAVRDIREGNLVSFLLKPASYYWTKFANEIPWRLMQSFFAVVAFVAFSVFLPKIVDLPNTFPLILMTIAILALAFIICFTFKMIVGVTAFWLVDFWGFQQIVEVAMLLFAGFVAPIELFPKFLQQIALATPFPYIIYFPVLSLQSRLSIDQGMHVIYIQLFWMILLCLLYKLLWKKGVKRFTGEGQ